MADILSTSGINSLIESYISSESKKSIDPLTKVKTKYQNLSTSYSTLSSKLSLLKSILSDFTYTGTNSLFNAKSAATSNSNFVTASATNSAGASTYSLRVNQLAKSDLVISQMLTASTANAISGTHNLIIKTGNGSTGEYLSKVEVTFGASETNQTMMEKIRDAINVDKAVVLSSAKTAANAYAGGPSSFIVNLNGTETTISVNGGGTYSDLISEVVNAVNTNVGGVLAEKIEDSPNPGDVKLRLTVNDTSKYISITNSSGFDLVSDLGISATNEKGASGIVTASAFSPSTGNYQFSLTAKESGLDYRITSLYDDTGGTSLNALGLNLNTTRTVFDQNMNTAGFVYSDITSAGNLLNAKINFNGIDVQRNSNTISDLAAGVTFSLKSVMQVTDSTVNVTTSNDVSAIKAKVENLIARFNDVFSYLKTNTSWSSGSRGVLVSDGNASSLLDLFRSTAYTEVTGLPADSLSRLSNIGITFSSTNGLSLSDSTKFEDEVKNNISEVTALFNSTNGIANTLYNSINPYVGSGGYLSNSKSSFDSSVTTYNNKIKSTQKRIDKSAEVLRKKYEQMQAQLAALYSQQSYFSTGGFFSYE